MPMTIMGITGARPNFMKIDPVLRALDKRVLSKNTIVDVAAIRYHAADR